MKNSSSNNFFEELHRARSHSAFKDCSGRRILRALHYEPEDSLLHQLAETRIRRVEQDLRAGRLPPFPEAQLHNGNLTLGFDLHGSPIRINADWLCSGLLTAANTGSGKSNLVFFLMLQCALLRFSTWLFEPYKTQLRLLLPLYKRTGKPLVILPWRNWRWNLLQCSGNDPHSHAAMGVDVLVRTLDLPGRATAILRQGIHELYVQFGVRDASVSRFPTLFHLYEWVKSQKDLNAAGREAILDRLGAFLVSLTPECGAWTRAWTHDDLAGYSIVFEMRGASEGVRSVLPQSLLFGVFQSRVNRGLVNGGLELLLVCEDAQRIFAERQTAIGDMSPMDELAGIIRGTGIGLWSIVQTMVGFSRRLRPNLAIKIFGRLGCHEDYATLAADCGITVEQLEYLRHKLTPGTFVGVVSIGSWTQPFIFLVPLAKLPAAPTQDEIVLSQSPLAALPTEFAEEFRNWSPHQAVEIRHEKTESLPTVDEIDLRVLRAIIAEPGKSVSHYCRKTRLNGQRMAGVRMRLIAHGFIREEKVAINPRGRAPIIIQPLPAAQCVAQDHQETNK